MPPQIACNVTFVYVFPLCIFKCALKELGSVQAKLHWLHLFGFFSTVHFHVFPQMACLKGCKVTLVTFVWLFPTVHVHVFLQIACLRGCKVTLVAFVLLLGNLRLQLWKLSKLTTNVISNDTKKKRRKMKNFQKILGWNTRLIPYRKIPVYRDFAKIPYRTVPEWNSSYRWGLLTSETAFSLLKHFSAAVRYMCVHWQPIDTS